MGDSGRKMDQTYFEDYHKQKKCKVMEKLECPKHSHWNRHCWQKPCCFCGQPFRSAFALITKRKDNLCSYLLLLHSGLYKTLKFSSIRDLKHRSAVMKRQCNQIRIVNCASLRCTSFASSLEETTVSFKPNEDFFFNSIWWWCFWFPFQLEVLMSFPT